MIRHFVGSAALLLLLHGVPTGAGAQPGGPGLTVAPRVGRLFANAASHPFFPEPATSAGFVADYRFRESPWGARAEAIRFVDASEDRVVLLIVDGVYHLPLPERSRLQPYLVAGTGLKWHEMNEARSGDDLFEIPGVDQTNLALHVGAGVDLWLLRGVAVAVEVGSYPSRFTRYQGFPRVWAIDVIASVGLRVALPKGRPDGER